MAFRVQPPPTGTLYSVLQKAKPGWSTKDLLKVYQKLQKVSIIDGESLARAVSEGSLNHILAEAGERKLKPSTLQLLRLASRDPGARTVQVQEDLPLLGPRHCFCGNCIRVPMCHQHADVLTMKLPSIKSGPPPLMPSRREASRWQAQQRQVVVAPLPRVKSEPVLSKAEARSRLFGDWNAAGRKLSCPAPIPLEAWPKKVLSPILATVPERTRRSVVLPQRALARREEAKEDVPVPPVEAQQSALKSASTSSFHSYATFVEKQGQDGEHQEGEEGEEGEEEIQHLEVAYSSQESYAMTFEGSSQPSYSNESGLDFRWSRTESDQENLFDEDLEDASDDLDQDEDDLADVTADVSGLLRSQRLNDTMEALKELSELDETLPVSRSPKPRKAPPVDHRQQVAAARRQQQRRRMIRAYG